jgi:hypothetical protein
MRFNGYCAAGPKRASGTMTFGHGALRCMASPPSSTRTGFESHHVRPLLRCCSPAPLFFKSIDSCVIERTQDDGRWWVLSRVLARVQVTSLARFMARLDKQKLPPTVDFTLSMRDWRVNQGIDEAVFATGGKR